LLVRFAPALDRGVQRVASLAERLAALFRRLRCTFASLAGALAEILARLAPGGGRVQQRQPRAAPRAAEECKRTPSAPAPVAFGHYQVLTFTLRNFLGSFRISAMSARISATVLFMFSYNSLLFSNCPAVPWPEFRWFRSSSIRPVTSLRRLYKAASFSSFPA